MYCCIPTPTIDSNTSTGMIWVTFNMPSAVEECHELLGNCQGISHCLESGIKCWLTNVGLYAMMLSICLSLCLFVCLLWNLLSRLLCGSTWQLVGAYCIVSDRLIFVSLCIYADIAVHAVAILLVGWWLVGCIVAKLPDGLNCHLVRALTSTIVTPSYLHLATPEMWCWSGERRMLIQLWHNRPSRECLYTKVWYSSV